MFPRQVVRVVTPGTVVEPGLLPGDANNYLAASWSKPGRRERAGVAYADITTGEFAATELSGADIHAVLRAELARLRPAEVLHPEALRPAGRRPRASDPLAGLALRARPLPGSPAAPLPGGLAGWLRPARPAPGGARRRRHRAVSGETQPAALTLLTGLSIYSLSDFMTLDAATRRNLELTETLRSGAVKGSLLGVLDHTVTPMGRRLLRQWVSKPCWMSPRCIRRARRGWSASPGWPAARRAAPRPQAAGRPGAPGQPHPRRHCPAARPGRHARNPLASPAGACAPCCPIRTPPWPPCWATCTCATLSSTCSKPPWTTIRRHPAEHRRHPPRLLGRAGRRGGALPPRPRVDRQPGGGRARAHGHQVAQGRLQQGLWLLHRGHPRQRRCHPRRIHPQADAGQRRALHHPRDEGIRDPGAQRRGAHPRDRSAPVPGDLRPAGRLRPALAGHGPRPGPAGCARLPGRGRRPERLRPPAGRRGRRARDPRRAPPGGRAEPERRALCAQRCRSSRTASACA